MTTETGAIMFADVSGSSRLFKTVGDVKARSIVAKVVAMMMDKTGLYNGTVIKTIGDECMSLFADGDQAAEAAIAIQRDISCNDYGAPLSVRIGFHHGPVILEDGDVYGEAVNDAADLVKVAKGGQVITCQRTLDALSQSFRGLCERFDEIRIKGGVKKEMIYLLQWQQEQADDANATQFMAAINTAQFHHINENNTLTLEYEGRVWQLGKTDMPFSVGRSSAADLSVGFHLASREHCKIDYRRGKFVLLDNSTNGTYLLPDGRNQLYLRREETPLLNSGVISFSPDADQPGPHILRYTCL